MPTDNEKLLDEITGYTQPETSKLNLQQAVNIDPDQAARDIEMARRNKLPVDTVERNRKEIENREYVNSVGNLEGFPAVEKFLSNRENAMVSVDDIENLKQTEVVLREDNVLKSAWDTFDNTSAGFFNRASTLVGNLVELTGNVGDSIRDTFDYLGVANPGIVIGDDGISFTKDLSRDIPSILTQTGKAISEGEGYEYIPHFTWERLKGDISVNNLTGYVFEQGVQSLPDMVAALYTLPAYIASRTEEIAEERVANDERKDVEMSDLAKSLVPALGVSLIERLGARVTFGTGGVKSPLDVLKATTGATLIEGGTEFVQEGIEYLGETLGTQKDFDAAEMFDRQLAGLVAGGGMGFGIRGTTSTMEAIANRTTRSITTRVESTGEQQMLDNLITYAQSSKTRGRAQDRYADFLRGNNSPREVFITPEGIEAAKQAGVELPPSLLKQDNDIGLDTTIDVATFGTDIAANEELMKILRPHVRLSAESLSLQEMENHQLDIQNMIQRAEQSKELKAEADRIYDEVKDQIVATGRQGELTARYSAQLIPAYATVAAERTGLPVSEVYQRMGFSVVGPTGDPTGRTMIQDDGGSFNITEQQAITEGYDTGDVLYHGSSSDTIEGIQRGDGNMFDGLFASDDERAAKSHGDNVHKFVLKNGVASNSDLDTESSRNFLIEQLDDDYNQLSEEDFERFYDSIVFEDDSFVWDENDDLTNSLMTALRVEDVSQLSWELQRLRGQITRQQGFDAVEMSDEHGTSYLLVGDGVRRLTDDPTGRTMTQRNSTAQEFKKALNEARAKNPNAPSVAEYDASEYENMDTYLLDDGKAGYAIESDGTLVGVFKSPDSNIQNALSVIVPDAIKNGATKLDAFEGFLTEQYAKYGFVEVDRAPWDEQYRPEGWTDEMGTPDVVYMELQDERSNTAETSVSEQIFNQERIQQGDGRIQQGDGEGRRSLQALENAPTVEGINGPIEGLVNVAEKYAADNGIDLTRQSEYVEVNPELATRIADAYEQMEHNPNDPAVKEAYENLIQQTMAQYQALVDAGYQFWFIDTSRDDNLEYLESPWNAIRDIAQNQQMGVFPTNEGFGTDAEFNADKNPLLADTGLMWPVGGLDGEMQPVMANDLFRAVHDAFGHGLEGAGFRARGEENAWQAHSRLFTGSALGAITSETRGQNSWLNYGPHGETNRTAKIEDTIFADQKTGLMPEWTWTEGRAGDATPVTYNQSQTPIVNPLTNKPLGPMYRLVPEGQQPKKSRTVYKLMKIQKARPGLVFPLFAKPEEGPVQGYTAGGWFVAEDQRPKIGAKQLARRPGIHAVNLPVFDQGKAKVKGSTRVWVEVEMPEINPDTQAESDNSTRLPNGSVSGVTDRLIGPTEAYDYKTNPNASTDAGGWPIAGSMKLVRIVGDGEVRQMLEDAGLENQIENSMTGHSDDVAASLTNNIQTVGDTFIGKAKTYNQSQTPTRNDIGLYSAVEKAVLDLNIQGWSKKSTKGKTKKFDDQIAALEATRGEQGEALRELRRTNQQFEKDNPNLTDDQLDEIDAAEAAARKPLVETARELAALRKQRELEATPRASGKEIWQKLKKEPGVKVEELEWLGLEEFLLSAPDKLTRDEVVSFINNNGVQVEEIETTEDSEGVDGGDVEDVYWSEPTPLDGEEYYEHRIPDIIDSGLWDEEAYDEVIRLKRDYIDANKEEDQSDIDFIDEQIYNEFTSARYELAKEAAREEYMDDPIVSITADIEGGTYEILGNDDAGYEVLTDGDIAADNIWSVNEAQVQAIAHARESRGYDDNDSGLKWESYVTEGDYTNYREIKLTLPTIDPQFEYDVHFDEPNIVSFMRLTDRELVTTTTKPEDRQVDYTVTTRGNNSDMGGTVIEVTDTVNNRVVYSGVLKQSAIDEAGGIEPFVESFKDKFKNNLKGQDFPGGYYINDDGVMLRKWNSDTSLEKDTFFIDEMQSDWHQQGRQKGYYDSTVDVNQLRADYGQTAENIRLVLDKVREALLPIAQGGIEQAQNLNVAAGIDGAMLNLVKNADDFLNSFTGESLESGLHALKNSPMATERLTQFADELTLLRKQADEISKNIKAQTEGVPDAPFKGNNWLNLALKRALVKAVEEGKDAFAWADANVLADRWSESYRKLYETQYDIKMPSMIKKLTKQTPQHIDFETGLEPVGDELGYWVIELTPELKEQIRKESFSLFQFAGQTSQTAQLDKLFTAQQMAANGASKGSIRTATGWFQGVDNQWRYEISDHDASLTGEITSDGAGLNNILNHPELFAAYPFIGNILVSRINNPEQGEKGSYNPNSQEIEINTSMTEEQQLSTLLHEIQHAIQHQEDFAFGGTNDIAWTTAVAEAVSDMSRQAQQLVSNWKIVNKGKILREERASELAHRSLMFKSMNKLIDYANHDKPSSVFRHIRNEVQWVYDSAIRENDDLRARATEIERMFYGIPRRGPKRNEHIREIAWAASQLLRDAIPEADLKLFKEDTRAVDGMVKALQRQANRARDTLKPLKAKEKDAAAAKYLAEKTQYKTPYSIYRSLAGEIEARTTQARQKLTPEERAARDPRMDEDIRADEAIIVLGSMELKIPAVARSVEQEQEPRGSITFTPNNEAIIKLGKASNLSTFLHEAGHLFLEMETRFAKEFGVTEDQQTLLDWLGVKSFDDIKVDQHEQFARGFEAYLREGKAPSVGLREAFSAFRDWLLRIYQNIMQLDVELNDEIRGVFDRMLATEAEIETALSAPNYEEFFRSQEQAGMSDEEWEKYQKTIAKRRESATRTIDEKLLAQYTRLKTAEWKEEKAPIVEQELERLSKLPVYQIIDDARQYPMDYDMLKEMVGVDKLPGKFIGLAKKGGVDPQEYAEAYGFNNVSQMYNAIVDVQPLKKTADESAEALMIEKYGDIFNDGTIEAEVREAVHNDEQASLLLQEINALKPPRAQAINTEQIRLNARNTIAKMKFTDIKPNKYNRAEIRAAQNAATATTPEDKYRFKVQQAVNHHLYREAVAAREAMIKQRKYIRGVQKRDYNTKQVAAEYVTNMKLLANMYDMRQKPERTIAIEQLLTWYETQINDENEFAQLQLLDVNLIRALAAREAGELADITLPTFDDLTVEDLRGVYDMLRHMRHVGGQMSDVAKAELQQEYAEIEASIEEHGGRNVKDQAGLPGKHTDLKRKISHLVNLLPSLRNLVRRLDGFTDGVLYDKLYRRIEDANSRKLKLGAEMYQRFEEELNDLHKIGLNRKDHKTYITDDGMEIDISSEHRFMMALYWGTESSRDAIRDGWGLTDNDVSRILADMPDEQVDVLNKVWAVNETMWPDLSAASVRLYGVAPPKLDATPFSINGKQLSGGHMRLFYDSSELEMKAEQEDAAKMATIVPSRAGSLYERVGSGGRAPLLDVNNMIRAIEDNVHFIAFAETGRQIAGIMNNKNIQAVMERKHGRGFRKAMIQNLENITSNRPAKETLPFVPQLSRLLRKAATFKYLSYSLRNAVQGLGAIPIAMEEVGITAWTGALARFASPAGHKEVVSFVQERSQFMTQRSSLVNREAAEHLNKIKLTGKAGHAWDVFVKYGFTPQTIIDSVIAYPVWIAKYEASMEVHGDESRAASEADTAVAESVGSGSDLHLGGVFQQNNTEFVKTMTVFGSWFNAYYQRVYKSTGGFNEFANVDAFKTIVTTPFIVAALSAALIMDLPEDGGDEEWWSWMLSRYAGFMAGTVPLLRDIYSSAGGFTPKTPLAGASEIPIRFANEVKAVMKGDQSSLKTTSDLINITTTVVPVPGAGNVTRVLNFVDSNAQGNETGSAFAKTYQALVEGPNRNK